MRIAVFGASGRTGQEVVNRALARGHEVVAFVRCPDVMKQSGEKFTVVKADVLNENDIFHDLDGCDAVLSCLGYTWTIFSEMTFYTDSGKSITNAMKRARVTRLVLVTSMCTTAKDGNPLLMEYIGRPFQFRRLRDMARLEEYITTSCPHITYTIARPSLLNNKLLEAEPLITMADRLFVPDGGMRMSRASLAKFMLDSLQTREWNNKIVALDMPKMDFFSTESPAQETLEEGSGKKEAIQN